MNELEHDGVGSEPVPAKTHDTEVLPNRPVAAGETGGAPSSDATGAAAASDETELEPPPIWDESEPLAEDPEPTEDAWAFLQHLTEEPMNARSSERRSEPSGALERALLHGLFRVDLEHLLAGVERALRSRIRRENPAPELLRLVSRARAAGASEPRLIEALLRAHRAGQIGADFGLLSALLARRLALPSLRVGRRSVESSTKHHLLRELQALVTRVIRSQGDRGLRELVRLSGRIGASASEQGRSLTELVALLARRIERDAAPARPAFESESRDSSRARRFRLPGRVEIVIYEE